MSTTARSLSTVNGFAARATLAALRALAIDSAPILTRTGLSQFDPDDRDRRISAVSQAQLMELASESAGDTAFGLHVALQTNPKEAGLLYYAVAAANDVREGLNQLARYSRIANDTVKVAIVPRSGGVTLALSYVGISRHRFMQIVEFQFAIVVKALREVTGRHLGPTRALCAHTRASGQKEFDRFYDCHVEFTAPVDALDFADETLNLPLLTSDRYLLETLRPYCAAATAPHSSVHSSLRSSVDNEVYRLLPHGRATLEGVATALGYSPRTLVRRLATERTTFTKVVDDLRHELSLQYLTKSNFTIAQIGWLLGFEQPESFSHAFRRWSGRTPSQVRSAPAD